MKPTLFPVLLFLLAAFLYSCKSSQPVTQNLTSWSYADGNGNGYSLTPGTPATLSYDPITKLESSTGEYDGGSPKKVNLNEVQLEALLAAFENALAEKDFRVETRLKGTGLVRKGTGENREQVHLGMKSPAKRVLENKLKEILELD